MCPQETTYIPLFIPAVLRSKRKSILHVIIGFQHICTSITSTIGRWLFLLMVFVYLSYSVPFFSFLFWNGLYLYLVVYKILGIKFNIP